MDEIKECPICGSNEFVERITTTDYTLTRESFKIKTCQKCELSMTSPRPPIGELARYYESPAYVSHTKTANTWFDKLYAIARTFTLKSKEKLLTTLAPERTILDYGCGTGHLLAHLKNKGWQIAGVEPTAKARHIAIENTGTNNIHENITRLSGPFSVITLWHVLEHIPELDSILNQLKTFLSEDGILIVAVPNLNSWDSNNYGKFWAAYDTPRHLWHFPKTAVNQLAAKSGMEITAILPMPLDAYYVSMLSEKYKHSGNLTLPALVRAMISGVRSNQSAKTTGEYSSLIYVMKHASS